MFNQLTQYLFQHKQVAIPQVGVFQLVQNPSTLDYANKQIQPPTYTVQFLNSADTFSNYEDQLNNIDLQHFGEKLKKAVSKKSIAWNGIGLFEFLNGQIQFQPQTITIEAFGAVEANKVLRENVQHKVLVGETQVMQSFKDMDEEVIQPLEKNSYALLVGWIMVIILFAFIIYLFVTSV